MNIEKVFFDMFKVVRVNDVFLIFFFGYGDMFGIGSEVEFYYLIKDLFSKDFVFKLIREEGIILIIELIKWIKNIVVRK